MFKRESQGVTETKCQANATRDCAVHAAERHDTTSHIVPVAGFGGGLAGPPPKNLAKPDILSVLVWVLKMFDAS
jgi:hypothetical protein